MGIDLVVGLVVGCLNCWVIVGLVVWLIVGLIACLNWCLDLGLVADWLAV